VKGFNLHHYSIQPSLSSIKVIMQYHKNTTGNVCYSLNILEVQENVDSLHVVRAINLWYIGDYSLIKLL